MSKINEYCGKEKLAILKELEAGQGSLSGIAYKYSINVSTLKDWRRRYELYGAEGLEFRSKNTSYSVELKLQAVQDYLSGKYSQHEIIRKYSIASRTQLRNWIKKYNSHSGLRSYKNGGIAAMTKGRTTTWKNGSTSYCTAFLKIAIIIKQPKSIRFLISKFINGLRNMMLGQKMLSRTDVAK